MSNAVSLVGVDSAGGVIAGPGKANWTWNGKPISVVGDSIIGHGLPPHTAPVITQGSAWMTIDGIAVTRSTSPASCGHAASGSADMYIP